MLKDHVKQVSDHGCAVQTDVAAWISFMSVLLSFHRRSRGLSWHIWGRRIHAQCFSSGKHQVIHASILHRSFSDDMTAWLSRLSPLSPLSPRHVQKWWQSGQAQSNQCPWLLPRKWRLRSARRWWLRLPREVWTIRPWPTGNDRLGSTCHHLSLCELLTKTKPPFAWDVSLYNGLFFFEFSGISMSKSPCRSLPFLCHQRPVPAVLAWQVRYPPKSQSRERQKDEARRCEGYHGVPHRQGERSSGLDSMDSDREILGPRGWHVEES